jgi:hypothetical protein
MTNQTRCPMLDMAADFGAVGDRRCGGVKDTEPHARPERPVSSWTAAGPACRRQAMAQAAGAVSPECWRAASVRVTRDEAAAATPSPRIGGGPAKARSATAQTWVP